MGARIRNAISSDSHYDFPAFPHRKKWALRPTEGPLLVSTRTRKAATSGTQKDWIRMGRWAKSARHFWSRKEIETDYCSCDSCDLNDFTFLCIEVIFERPVIGGKNSPESHLRFLTPGLCEGKSWWAGLKWNHIMEQSPERNHKIPNSNASWPSPAQFTAHATFLFRALPW